MTEENVYEPKIKMIFAYTDEYVFGNANKLPWTQHIKKDMEMFKQFTSDCILVMGRSTFESLPVKLRGLPHFVISSKPIEEIVNQKGQHPDYVGANIEDVSFEAVTSCVYNHTVSGTEMNVCIIGGASILLEAASFVDEALLTEVHFRSKEPRYYDAPIYIDIPGIEKSLSESPFISLEDTKEMTYKVPKGEVEQLIFTKYVGG